MPIMLKLETLTISSNVITDTESAVKYISMKCPRLIHLNLTSNPLDIDQKSAKYRKGIKKVLGSLFSLDGVPFEGMALPKASGVPVSQAQTAAKTTYLEPIKETPQASII